MKKKLFTLQFFGEGGAAAGGADAGVSVGSESGVASGETTNPVAADNKKGRKSNPLADVKYGIQDNAQTDSQQDDNADTGDEKTPETTVTTKSAENKSTEFENLINGEYKAEFDARVQRILNKRFGENKKSEEQMKAIQPILDMMSQKYGVDSKDLTALAKAIEEDDSLYEEEAVKKGLTVKQLKDMKRLERDNANLREAQREAQRRQQSEQIYARWMQQTNEFNQKYGMQINFEAEAGNPDFTAILKNGGSVEAAYKAVHFDEMMGGAMFRTAQTVSQKMANNIQSKSARPTENGVSARATAVTKTDVNSLTKKDREEIERRVARGEKIRF